MPQLLYTKFQGAISNSNLFHSINLIIHMVAQKSFLKIFIYFILTQGYVYWFVREEGGERKKHWCVRETLVCCLLYAPQLEIKPPSFPCMGRCSNQPSHLARPQKSLMLSFLKLYILICGKLCSPTFPVFFEKFFQFLGLLCWLILPYHMYFYMEFKINFLSCPKINADNFIVITLHL